MANKDVFTSSNKSSKLPKTDAVNDAGGNAYSFSAEHELAQFAVTGTFNDTFYSTAERQLERVLELSSNLSSLYLAKLAVYARENGKMKDMPAFLCAILLSRGPAGQEYLKLIFSRVINNGKMLRNFVQIVRSGKTGRRSLGSCGKGLVRSWFDRRTEEQIYNNSTGSSPSMADVIKLARPVPRDPARRSFYGYMIGRSDYSSSDLPFFIKEIERFKADRAAGKSLEPLPNAPFEVLQGFKLSSEDWKEIARRASWTQTRMNLNTFARHGVFHDKKLCKLIANRLSDRELVRSSGVFPYQLLMSYMATDVDVPAIVRDALQDAMEIAVENVTVFDTLPANVCVDVSGSMHSPVTGYRKGSTTAVRCIDVAALVGAIVLRKNPESYVIPFAEDVRQITLNGRDSIVTNAQKLAATPGGGTNCSSALKELNRLKSRNELVVYVSDNESWIDKSGINGYSTETMKEWKKYKARVRNAKLVCIDIRSNGTTQAPDSSDILNVGGFSDSVFETIERFVGRQQQSFVEEVRAVKLKDA